MKKLWLYLYFPSLQMDCQFPPDSQAFHSKTIVILDAKSNSIKQLNQTALTEGLKQGMGLGTAATLSQQLQVEPYNIDIESNRLKQLADTLYQLTSDICLSDPNGILLRINHMLKFYQGLHNYWQALKAVLNANQVAYQYATGITPICARLLAESGWNRITDSHDEMREAVLKLPISNTTLPKKAIENLKRSGIRDIAELANIPLADIAKRFDIHMVTYMGRLLGELHHNIHFYHPEGQFNRRLELLYEIDNTQRLQTPLKQLLTALESFLQLREQVTNEVLISLYQRENPILKITVSSGAGENRADAWLSLIALKLENTHLAAPVLALSLTTGKTCPQIPEISDFFSAQQSRVSHEQLAAILQAKLGDDAVQRLQLQDDFRPEICNQWHNHNHRTSPPDRLLPNRPLFLLNPMQPLTEKVRLISGPERIELGWWDDRPIIRDYFIAYCASGRWYWVYRTPEQQWYLHGVFS